MAVNKVILNEEVLIDLTADTAVEASVESGKTFHKADGTIGTGSLILPAGNIDIIENRDYDITNFASAVVNVPIPEGYIQPSGTLEITANGTHDVTNYISAEVNIQSTTILQTKEITVTENGTTEVVPDDGYNGLDKAILTVDVPIPNGYIKPNGTTNITINGTYDVKFQEFVKVEVPTEGGEPSEGQVIDVKVLPTVGIENVIYKTTRKALIQIGVYISAATAGSEEDIIYPDYAVTQNIAATYYIVDTLPTEGFKANDIYLVENEPELYISLDGTTLTSGQTIFEGLPYKGVISNINQMTEEGYYALVSEAYDFYTYSAERRGFHGFYQRYDEDSYVDFKNWVESASEGALSVFYHYVDTVPAEDEIIENTQSEFHFYYVADQKAIGSKEAGGVFEILPDKINIVSNFANINGELCAVASDGWVRYQEPYKVLTVEENGIYNTEDVQFVNVNLEIFDAAVAGIWKINEAYFDNFPGEGSNRTTSVSVNFTTTIDGEIKNCTGIRLILDDGINYFIEYLIDNSWFRVSQTYANNTSNHWQYETAREIDFGKDPQLVKSDFKNWLETNAILVESIVAEETLTVVPKKTEQVFGANILYKNVVVQAVPTQTATVSAGSTAKTHTPEEGYFYSSVTVNGVDLSDLSTLRIPCGLYFKTFPKTEYAIGDWLSVKDGVLCVPYTDGTSEEVNLNYSMVSDFTTSKPGKYMLTVSHSVDGRTYRTTYQYIVSDGPRPFYINSVTYYTDVDMTWEEWCASNYNTDGWIVSNSNITKDSITFVAFNELVSATDTIMPFHVYTTKANTDL